MFFPVLDLFTKNYFSRIYAVRAGDLAALTLTAQPDPHISSITVVNPESFGIGSRLFGPGKLRIYLEYGTVFYADGASYAVLKIIVHCIYSSHFCAAAKPVAMAMPWPHPYFITSEKARMLPHAKRFS